MSSNKQLQDRQVVLANVKEIMIPHFWWKKDRIKSSGGSSTRWSRKGSTNTRARRRAARGGGSRES